MPLTPHNLASHLDTATTPQLRDFFRTYMGEDMIPHVCSETGVKYTTLRSWYVTDSREGKCPELVRQYLRDHLAYFRPANQAVPAVQAIQAVPRTIQAVPAVQAIQAVPTVQVAPADPDASMGLDHEQYRSEMSPRILDFDRSDPVFSAMLDISSSTFARSGENEQISPSISQGNTSMMRSNLNDPPFDTRKSPNIPSPLRLTEPRSQQSQVLSVQTRGPRASTSTESALINTGGDGIDPIISIPIHDQSFLNRIRNLRPEPVEAAIDDGASFDHCIFRCCPEHSNIQVFRQLVATKMTSEIQRYLIRYSFSALIQAWDAPQELFHALQNFPVQQADSTWTQYENIFIHFSAKVLQRSIVIISKDDKGNILHSQGFVHNQDPHYLSNPNTIVLQLKHSQFSLLAPTVSSNQYLRPETSSSSSGNHRNRIIWKVTADSLIDTDAIRRMLLSSHTIELRAEGASAMNSALATASRILRGSEGGDALSTITISLTGPTVYHNE